MFTTIQQFIDEYRNESVGTQKLLDTLTDASLKQESAAGFRTIGHLAWHIVPFEGLLHHAGLKFEAPSEESEAPTSAAEIAATYRSSVASLLEAVESQWTDEKLKERVTIYGMDWTFGTVLNIFIKHEVHHRGQLTALMRVAGLPVTGMYGPSKDEWIKMGREPLV